MKMNSEIIHDKMLLMGVAYLFCKEMNIEKYNIPKPDEHTLEELITKNIIKHDSFEIFDNELGYACYEYYRQQDEEDYFNQLLIREAKEFKNVLDLCCGPGGTLPSLLKNSPQNIYAIDLNPRNIALIREIHCKEVNGVTKIFPYVSDAHNIPLKDQSIDFVVCRVALHYLNLTIVLKEISRILSPGGKVFFIVHGSGYPLHYLFGRKKLFSNAILSFLKNALRANYDESSKAKFFTPKYLNDRMSEQGIVCNKIFKHHSYKHLRILPIYFGVSGFKYSR